MIQFYLNPLTIVGFRNKRFPPSRPGFPIRQYFMISKISVVKYFVGYSKFISCLCLHAVSLVTRVLL